MTVKTIAELRQKYGYDKDRDIRVYDGWAPLLDAFLGKLVEEGFQDFVDNFECKEKFAELRISFNRKYPYPDKVMFLSSMAAYEADVICEFCAGPGTPYTIEGWMHISCSACAKNEAEKHRSSMF